MINRAECQERNKVNKQITSHQLYSLTATISLGGSILVITSTVASIAKQDAWLSGLLAVLAGIPVMLMYYFLGSKYPGLTLIGMTKKILGKYLGFIVSAGYVLLFVIITTHIPWYIGSYFDRIMHETPINYINVLFVAGIVIAFLYGIEVIARVSEIFVIVVTFFFILFMFLLLKDIKPVYLLPVMENGILPPLKGSLFLSSYITFTVINILMIFPRYIRNVQQAKKSVLKGFLWSGTVIFVSILVTTLVLGYALTARACFPSLLLAAEINVGKIVTRLEYILSTIWLFTQFMIGLAYFYSAVTSLSELIKLKDHKRITWPFGLFVLVMSGVAFPSSAYHLNWVNTVYTPMITTFGLFIPFVLMLVYLVRKRFVNHLI